MMLYSMHLNSDPLEYYNIPYIVMLNSHLLYVSEIYIQIVILLLSEE